MRIYIASLIVGIVVGVLYSLVNVRSPAPPTWALVGLLGMLMGEQLIPVAKQYLFNPSDQANSAQIQSTEASKTAQSSAEIGNG
ncbi:DUF1427 family protein [Psychrobacter phenylpyruvicus]|uniref:Uncharacterized protein conserved in bacteria n=1 Tax=Psychrobacter phenylpyruvicus TaxID=29432 RepID=A0A379LQ76_9GAMM|nr:Uncharacterized protein conserved in bacteria [Psychrobacter phenylpyruvicus]